MPTPWTTQELSLIIADYFAMLADERSGKSINKTEHRNWLKPLLNNRSDKSIEFKHMNISAVLSDLGIPYIKGYKPLHNIQRMLADEVVAYLENHKNELHPFFNRFSEEPAVPASGKQRPDFSRWIENPPAFAPITKAEEPQARYRTPFKINFLEREQNNRLLGEAGEAMVLEYEKWRLLAAGKENLADKIEWISKNEGDGAGFDILSFDNNGADRYIEVKTTKLGKETPIFFSLNEYQFSQEHKNHFHLYRLFDFTEHARMFTAKGSFNDFCAVEPVSFKGKF